MRGAEGLAALRAMPLLRAARPLGLPRVAIGGIAREFYGRIWEHYQQPGSWTRQAREEYVNRRGSANDPAGFSL